MGLYEFTAREILMPVAERMKGWPVRKHLRSLEETQWWSPEQLRELQNEKLRAMIRHSYETVQYYRELFDAHKLTPDDIRTADDLPKIPILTKDTVKLNFPNDRMKSSAYDSKKLIVSSSSGSTGAPVSYYFSGYEKGFRWGCIYRWRRWTGWDIGKKWANLHVVPEVAFKKYPMLAAMEKKLNRLLVLPVRDMDQANVGQFVQDILDFDPYLIKSFPSVCYYMARYLKEHDMKLNVKACVCNGETLYPFIRELVEERFTPNVFDHYGSEGVETAAQCSPRGKFHISAEATITEIIDDQGNVLPPGSEGRLVVTALEKWAMPFIRYDTQDIATMAPHDEVCGCGRGLPLLDSVRGRIVDVSVTPSGKLLTVYAFTYVFAALADQIDTWQVVHESPGELVLKVVARGQLKPETAKHLISTTQEYVGVDVNVRLEEVDFIPKTTGGKRRLFVTNCSTGTQVLSGQ